MGLGAAAVAFCVAFFVPWLPTNASTQGHRIDVVFWVVSIICIGIFALVASVILYAIVRRAKRGGLTLDQLGERNRAAEAAPSQSLLGRSG